MDENIRKLLVEQQINKANKFISQAYEMYGLKHWDLTANRCYYACFHAVQGLFISRGIVAHTHAGMISQFNLNFIKTNILEVHYGSFLARMMQLRQKADYNCDYDVSQDEVADIIGLSKDFTKKINSLAIVD